MQFLFSGQCFQQDSLTGVVRCLDVLWIMPAFAIVCLGVAVLALVRCVPKDSQRFEMSFKRTKGFWLAMTGGAVLLTLFGIFPGSPFSFLFPVIGVIMASVYLADVEPEVRG
ncbi:MAG: DUF2516 family protein [Nesterenkonia sp.]|uniref:DUF2516 family protein n=1 Tax=Nesterenkonia marinintestina TaxID=2979865 RepID=UPI0021C21AB3|nr:DUF2516 family protein [Nesterenkonia sp. GX14115]MDO5493361.1 DUF2516 family protein [Nesterenkonia sp.]